MAKRKRTKKKKPNKHIQNASIAIILLLLALVLLWPYLRSAFLTAFVPIGRGTSGSLDERISGQTIFANGQTVLVAPASGSIRFTVEDGDSVRVGDVIAEIGDKTALSSLTENLVSAQQALQMYQDQTSNKFVELTESIQECYESAVSVLYGMQVAYASGNTSKLIAKEKQFSDQLEVLSRHRTQLMALEDRRAQLAHQVEVMQIVASSSSVKILAPVSGVFCSQLTSLDLELSTANLVEKDASELTVLAQDLEDAVRYRVEDGQNVSHGDMVGRIVSGEDVKFFMTVKTEYRPDVKVGSKVLLELENEVSVAAKIEGVVDGKPPGYSIIFGEVEYVASDKFVRTSHASLVTRRERGIIVPFKCLVEKDGETGVLVVNKTYATFQPVEVKMVKGDQAVVQGITETSEIVLNGIKFFEGRRVR